MSQRLMSEMVRQRRPVTLAQDATVAEACRLMHERHLGAVLVTDPESRLQGIFTGRDAVRWVGQGEDPRRSLRDAMTPSPSTMSATGTAIEALRLMEDGGFRHVPVVDDGRVVGIVAWGDFRGAEHDRLETETGYWERL